MNEKSEPEAVSLYTSTYTEPVAHALLAIALTPTGGTLDEVRRLMRAELENAYRAGQASSPASRRDALTLKIERERALLRRAIGIISDLSRLEVETRAVLDAHASSEGPHESIFACKHRDAIQGADYQWCAGCGAIGGLSRAEGDRPVWVRPSGLSR